MSAKLGIYYEHPDWFRPLFDELRRRRLSYDLIHAGRQRFDPTLTVAEHAVVLNRMSPSAYLRDAGHAIFYTADYLAQLERRGTRVINGVAAWQTEVSKARQLALLNELG